jgi:predicted Zn-dependent protease
VNPLRSKAPLKATRTIVTAVAAALLLSRPLPLHAQVNLPALGDAVSEGFGVGEERKLGDQIMREIRRDPDYLDDPVVLEYLQNIWQALLAAARKRGDIGSEASERFAWEAFLVRDRSVNAFALPGGYVGVHLGLMAATATPDELASVLAHEMSHVTQRHIARSIANSQRQSMVGLAAIILGALAASRSTGSAANAIFVGGQAAAAQGQLNFSRDMEREADRVGFAVLTSAGFAPAGMASMFQKLENAYRLNDSNSFPYLRSHPLTTERIGEARARLGAAPAAPPSQASLLEHAIVQAHVRVLMDPRAETLQRLQGLDGQAPGAVSSAALADRVSALATSALASSALRDWSRAESAAQAVLSLVRGSPRSDARAERAAVMLQAQLLLERGESARAAEVLKPFVADTSRPMALLRSQIALSSRDDAALRRQADELQTRVALAPSDATAWAMLGQTQERLGRPLRALRAQAESRYAVGDLSGALDRLRAGQRQVRGGGAVDFIEASVIDARLRDIEAERRQLAADMRRDGRPGEPP